MLTVIDCAADLYSTDKGLAQATAARIRYALADAPLTIVAALDRALRDGGLHRQADRAFLELTPAMLSRVDHLGRNDRRLALIIATCVRSGYTRADALRRLMTSFDPWIAAAAIVRLTDYVQAIANDAERALRAHLRPSKAAIFVRTLALIERLDTWVRASPVLTEIPDMLAGKSRLCERALWDAARAGEPGLTLPACRLLHRRLAGDARQAQVLTLALADRSPITRRWAAETIASPRDTPPELRRTFLEVLARDKSPAIRRLAIRLWHREADGTAQLLAAAFDGNADVRHHARHYLARRDAAVDYRAHALDTLRRTSEDNEPTTQALIGALATLSDFGRREDLGHVQRFIGDPRARVAAEARRTSALLGDLP